MGKSLLGYNHGSKMTLNLQQKMIILVVSMAMFIELLDGTALNTSLPQIAKDFSLHPSDLSLAITTYLFALGVCIPLSAFFVQLLGIKKTIISAFCIFTLGSIGCGLSETLEQLLFFRFVQGIGGSFMLPVGRLVIAKTFGMNLVNTMVIVTSISLTGPMVGPVLGGYLTTFLGWKWIFFINIPFSLISIFLILKYFSSDFSSAPSKFDWVGFCILFFGFGLITFSPDIYEKSHAFMFGLAAFILGLIILCFYIHWSRISVKPLVNIQIFKNNTFKNITWGNFLIRFATGGVPFIIPILLYQLYEFSPFYIGLLMVPFVFGTWIIKPFMTKVLKRINNKLLLLTNTLLLAGLQCSLIFFIFSFNLTVFILYGICMGCLNSIQFSLMNSSMFLALHDDEKANGNAIYLSLSQLGGCLGVTLTAFIFACFYQFTVGTYTMYYFSITVLATITFASAMFFERLTSNFTETSGILNLQNTLMRANNDH
jgi:DHA2 family multidrug resistance protein-like MFS transporter